MSTSLNASGFGRSLQGSFIDPIVYQLCNLDLHPHLQTHYSFGVRITFHPELPVLTLRHPLLLEIPRFDDLRFTLLHMRSFLIVVTQNKYMRKFGLGSRLYSSVIVFLQHNSH